MKKYIFPVLLILVILASFIIIQDVKRKHSSQVQSYDKQLSDLKKNNAHYEHQNKSFELLTDSLKTKYLQSKSLSTSTSPDERFTLHVPLVHLSSQSF
jgi:ABC-type transporter MlaC component